MGGGKKEEILFIYVLKFSAEIGVLALLSSELRRIVLCKEAPRSCFKNTVILIPRFGAAHKACVASPYHCMGFILWGHLSLLGIRRFLLPLWLWGAALPSGLSAAPLASTCH